MSNKETQEWWAGRYRKGFAPVEDRLEFKPWNHGIVPIAGDSELVNKIRESLKSGDVSVDTEYVIDEARNNAT